ncbi:MAG: RNA 2',3'-cyclic phosphodiesterase [Rhodoferax sp.]|uniref:RNA 2',3'-cyclic phosphodiesterase n=1 Tax=Rhodoferax sp. TaxID=50421 RepID=UPI0013FE8FC1|nr:RNA 2',3'-cyclic phosphodiesterase [Rhodoferax sp.]NDP37202.1 RNA 2',3'-cyclic phosphodiesterase [Rhodoferax sp.]
MDPGKPPVTRKQRLFLALVADEPVQSQLNAHAKQWTWPAGCVPCLPADWHITLHFIGAMDADRVERLAAGVAVPFQPFELVLDQSLLWPHGLAILGATVVPPPLRALYERLGAALRGLDVPVESRPYQPHVTLARHAGAAIPPTAFAPVRWPVPAYALVLSTGDRQQRYRVIHQYG